MKVLGIWGPLGRQGSSCWKGKEKRELYNEVGGIFPTTQFPLELTMCIWFLSYFVSLSKEEGFW